MVGAALGWQRRGITSDSHGQDHALATWALA